MLLLSMNNELENIRKEAVVVWFKVLSLHFPIGTEEGNELPQSGEPVSEPGFELGFPVHIADF
jgi:hypothetical protein